MRSLYSGAAGAVFLLSLALTGCGGGGGSSKNTPVTRVTPAITINWAERSRATVSAPSSALRAVVTLNGVGDNITNVTYAVARPTGTSSITQTYASPQSVPAGNYTVNVTFYADPIDNVVVGSATGTANFTSTGSPGNVVIETTENPVSQVTFTTGSLNLNPGASRDLSQITSVLTGNNSLLAVSPGSILYTITGGGNAGTIRGTTLNALSPGTLTVVAQVNGRTSAPFTINITAPSAGGTATGRVTDASGSQLTGVTIRTSDGTNQVQATSDNQGSFTLPDVPEGQRVLTYSLLGCITANEIVAANGGTIPVPDVTLDPYNGPELAGPPVITLDQPVVNDANGTAAISGRITNLDSNEAVIVVNGQQAIVFVDNSGEFQYTAVLGLGENRILVQATNALAPHRASHSPFPITRTLFSVPP